MMKKNKASESLPGDKPRASKRRTQQSAPLASAVSTWKQQSQSQRAVAAEGAPLGAEVAKGTSASNVVEEEWKMPALPKYAAVPRAVFGAGEVEAQGTAANKMEDIEEEEDNKEEDKKKEDKEDEDGDDDSASGNEEEEESGNDGSEYNPDASAGDGTVNLLADDVDNLPDDKKPSPKEKVSSPFDLPILPIVKTVLLKQGKKGKQGKKLPDGDDDSILLLSNEEDPPLTKKKKVLATKLSPAGSSSKVGTSTSSEDALLMIKGCQEAFFNLPWQNYVSVFVLFTFLFS
jgi:hypothetical protein